MLLKTVAKDHDPTDQAHMDDGTFEAEQASGLAPTACRLKWSSMPARFFGRAWSRWLTASDERTSEPVHQHTPGHQERRPRPCAELTTAGCPPSVDEPARPPQQCLPSEQPPGHQPAWHARIPAFAQAFFLRGASAVLCCAVLCCAVLCSAMPERTRLAYMVIFAYASARACTFTCACVYLRACVCRCASCWSAGEKDKRHQAERTARAMGLAGS